MGGGISGLAAAWQLNKRGQSVTVVEARERVGGRIWTVDHRSTAGETIESFCDLGPSWFWDGQPLIRQLLEQFDIPFFQQHAAGDTLYQQQSGAVDRLAQPSPMSGALRVAGGLGSLTDALAKSLNPNQLRLQHVVRSIRSKKLDGQSSPPMQIVCDIPSGEVEFDAEHVVLALPPRLAAGIEFTPALPSSTFDQFSATPTWMAGHAKFFAVYDRPFWREQGLCGSAISRKGPLAEIHDASPTGGRCFSLFGFAGIPPQNRARVGAARLEELALEQLVELFGGDAATPLAVQLQDWSCEDFTATAADQVPQTRHPQYGLRPDLGTHWQDRVHLISSETSFVNGGLVEGALEGAHRLISQFTDADADAVVDGQSAQHTASMGWDWL